MMALLGEILERNSVYRKTHVLDEPFPISVAEIVQLLDEAGMKPVERRGRYIAFCPACDAHERVAPVTVYELNPEAREEGHTPYAAVRCVELDRQNRHEFHEILRALGVDIGVRCTPGEGEEDTVGVDAQEEVIPF